MEVFRRVIAACALLLSMQQAERARGQEGVELERLPRVLLQPDQQIPAPGEAIPAPSPENDNSEDDYPAGPANAGDFPALPPDPYTDGHEPLPPLEEELYWHGGSYLYAPEGDRWNWPEDCDAHYQVLRLPEDWQKPRPFEKGAEFLGVGPINTHPDWRWPDGPCQRGYNWEPRFVGYGQYQIFGFAFEQNNQRQDAIGHQLLVDLDLRLTGTERFHVQYRPIGRKNTGGSYYQFSDPAGYIDNSTAVPDRYWFEGEIHSIFGGCLEQFQVADVHFVLGQFPFVLHNSLLMNTDLLGTAINKNTIFLGDLSNLNIQLFAAREDVAAYADADGYVYGINFLADRRHAYYEATYAFLQHEFDSSRDMHFAAFSRTQLYGPRVIATRAMFKFGDSGGTGDGQLFVLESNRTRCFDGEPFGVEKSVCYCNAFWASEGWRPISGGNFNRLQTAFEVNPLITLAAGNLVEDNWGVALGAQLFRHHEDESIIPEIAVQAPMDEVVYGFGLRYLRKTSARSFFEVLGLVNESDDPQFDRQGVFVAETIIF